MKIIFTVKSEEKKAKFDPDDFNREDYLEKMGLPSFVTEKLEKQPDLIRFTAEAGGLRINRELLGISIDELSEKTGIPVSLLRQYEEGEKDLNNAGLPTLLKLCRAMDCRLSEILTDRETIDELEKYLEED